MPAWDYVESGKVKEARLDVTYTDSKGVRCHVDVVGIHALGNGTGGPTFERELHHRARVDGRAACTAVADKRGRYRAARNPGANLVPFAFESLGRLSEECRGFLRAFVGSSAGITEAYQALSYLVQRRLAESLLSAMPGGSSRRRRLK